MTKYTKRQYEKDLAANETAKAINDAILESFQDRLDAGETVADLTDEWNAAYDAEYDIKNERHAIEQRFRTRNWTWQDHQFAELVSANID